MELAHGERIAYRRKLLGQATGAEKLGCSLFEIAPGKRAFPFHYHFANEEALYILEGSAGQLAARRRVSSRGAAQATFCSNFRTGNAETMRISWSTPDPRRFATFAFRP